MSWKIIFGHSPENCKLKDHKILPVRLNSFMLKRWNTLICDAEPMLKFLHVILTSLKLGERLEKRKERKPKRLLSLYETFKSAHVYLFRPEPSSKP